MGYVDQVEVRWLELVLKIRIHCYHSKRGDLGPLRVVESGD